MEGGGWTARHRDEQEPRNYHVLRVVYLHVPTYRSQRNSSFEKKNIHFLSF